MILLPITCRKPIRNFLKNIHPLLRRGLGILLVVSSVAEAKIGYYKGETPHQYILPDNIPCKTYTFHSGPYIGINPGIRTNYNNTPAAFKGLEGTLSLGYAMLNSSFYLGSEIFAQHDAQLQNYRNNSASLKTTWGYGLSVIPGFILADTIMGYLRVGVINTHFEASGGTITGGQVGVGLQAAVAENWDIRSQYVYSFYESLSDLAAPRSDDFSIGFIYKF